MRGLLSIMLHINSSERLYMMHCTYHKLKMTVGCWASVHHHYHPLLIATGARFCLGTHKVMERWSFRMQPATWFYVHG